MKDSILVRAIANILLLLAVVMLILFAVNLHSRLHFHGPDYSFFLWLGMYIAGTGAGLRHQKKWALILFIVPSVIAASLITFYVLMERSLMPWALFNLALSGGWFYIALSMGKTWHECTW